MKQIQISPDKAQDYINHIAHSEKTEKIKAIKLFLEWCLKTGRISEDEHLNLTPLLMGVEAKKERRNIWQQAQAKISNIQMTLSSLFTKVTPDDLQRTVATAHRSGLLTYVSLLSLLLFIGALGAGIYSQFFIKPSTPFAYPTLLTPGSRTLSFQGRLTDSLGNPITTSTNVTFKLYDNSSGGTQLYTTGACSLTPDQDGIFSAIIGQSCGSAIGSTVFSENANVYLETTVAAETLSPRQQIANVGYAINAENLQGFPPGTNTSNIPFINRDGDMYFHVANPGIRSSHASANFTLSSAVGVVVQSAGTGDISLTATGSGAINLKTANALHTTTLDTNGDLKIGGGTFNNTSGSEDLYVTGNIEADGTIYGNGSGLTGITATGIAANTLDFSEFKNSMALDANLTLAQGAYTWAQTFTGTTGPGKTYTASGAVTAGNAAAFDINASNASTSVPVVMISNAGSSYGLRINDDGTTTDSTPFIVDSAGNVGIGTTTAGAALDVNGNILVQGTGTIDTRAAGTLTIGGTTQTGLILGRSGQSSRIANLTTDGPVYTSGANGTLNSEAQLAIARGGTNTNTTPSNGQVAYGTGTAYAFTTGGTTGNCLTYNSGSAPTWGTCLNGTMPWSSLTNPTGALSLSMSTNATSFAWAQTTTNAFTNTFDSLTSGKGLYLSSTATGLTGNMMELDLTGSNSGNTGNVLRAAVSGTSSAATPLMVTNLGTGSSFRVNDATGDTDTTPFIIDASGNVGIGDATPASLLTVGNSDLFQVDTNGDVVKLKNLTYSWPSAHTANGALVNNGSGTLSWSTLGSSNITDNSLDFVDFQDTLDLDANLTLNQTTYTWSQSFTGTTTTGLTYAADSLTSGKGLYVSSTATGMTGNLSEFLLSGDNSGNTGNVVRIANTGTSSAATPLMVTNLGTGSSFRVNDATGDTDTTPFVIDASGNVGIGTSAPAASLHVSGTSAIFGVGEAGTPTATTIRGAAASGTDIAGANLTFDASNGTGTGGSGQFSFRTASNGMSRPVFDASSTSKTGTGGASSVTFSHTIGTTGTSGKTLLLVGVSIRGTTAVSSVTYNGVNLSSLSTQDAPNTNARVELWYLKNPSTGANNVVVTMASSVRFVAGATSFYNVDQTNTFGTTQTSSGTSLDATVSSTGATSTDVQFAVYAKHYSGDSPYLYAPFYNLWHDETANATASNNVRGGGEYMINGSGPGWGWITNNRNWATIGVAIKGISSSGSTANTLSEMLNIGQTSVTVKGLFNIGPTLRYTRTGVAYTANDAAKDAQCVSEFGSTYQTATLLDVQTYGKAGTDGSTTQASFNVAGNTANTFWIFKSTTADTWVRLQSGTGATTSVACVRKDAPLLFTRWSAYMAGSDSSKDTLCSNSITSNYQAARLNDVGMYMQVGDLAAGGPYFNIAGDSTNSWYLANSNTNRFTSTTGGTYPLACTKVGTPSGADYAEFIQTVDTPTAGDILTVDERNEVMAKREDKAYSGKMLGIVATEPGFVLGSESQENGNTVLALSGRVPVKVMTDNPSTLMIGDHITSASLSGVGQKLTRVGPTVGKLLQSGSSWNENTCLTVDSFDTITWPQGDGKNQDKPCFKIARDNVPESIRSTLSGDYLYIGKLMVQIGLSWADPAIYMTGDGKVKIALLPATSIQNSYQGTITDENSAGSSVFALTDVAGSVIEKSITASRAVLANVESGLLISQKAIINSLSVTRLTAASVTSDSISSLTGVFNDLTVRERLTSPLVQTETLIATGSAQLAELETSVVKPDSSTLTIDLSQPKVASEEGDKGPLASVVIRGREGKKVAELDDRGNATFSGTIAASQTQTNELTADSISTQSVEAQKARIQSLEATDATLSGRIIAKDIQSENITKLTSDTQNLYTNVNQIQSLLAGIQTQKLSDAQFYQNLGNSPLSFDIDGNTTLSENLTVAGDTKLYNASVANSFTAGNIYIQDNSLLSLTWDLKLSALATITLFDGSVQIARDGTITTQGTLIAKGGVKTDRLEATTPDKDLNVVLGSSTTVNEQSGETETRTAKFTIQDTTGMEQASIDSSGSAQFKNLSLHTYSDPVVLSPMDNFQKNGVFKAGIETTDQSAGAGVVPENEDEVVIYNSLIKQNSLVYLTPVNNIPDLQLTVISKNVCSSGVVGCKPSFTVSSGSLNHGALPFNWLIIN